MSSLSGGCVGGGGCGLCGTETSPGNTHFLTPEDFEIIQPLLLSSLTTSSEDSDLANNNNSKVDWTRVENSSQVVFCADCQSFLKEMKRLQALLKLVSSQLDTVVAKVKAKYNAAGKGQVVGVKPEPIIYDDDNNDNLLLL